MEERICLLLPPTAFDRRYQSPAGFPFSVTPSLERLTTGTGIFRLFPITYAFRPRLRGRLTLSGLTFLRKPWAFGGRASHPSYRYSSRHNLFSYLQRPSRVRLLRHRECSPTNDNALRSFGGKLSPDHYRRKFTRPVSCYALFE